MAMTLGVHSIPTLESTYSPLICYILVSMILLSMAYMLVHTVYTLIFYTRQCGKSNEVKEKEKIHRMIRILPLTIDRPIYDMPKISVGGLYFDGMVMNNRSILPAEEIKIEEEYDPFEEMIKDLPHWQQVKLRFAKLNAEKKRKEVQDRRRIERQKKRAEKKAADNKENEPIEKDPPPVFPTPIPLSIPLPLANMPDTPGPPPFLPVLGRVVSSQVQSRPVSALRSPVNEPIPQTRIFKGGNNPIDGYIPQIYRHMHAGNTLDRPDREDTVNIPIPTGNINIHHQVSGQGQQAQGFISLPQEYASSHHSGITIDKYLFPPVLGAEDVEGYNVDLHPPNTNNTDDHDNPEY